MYFTIVFPLRRNSSYFNCYIHSHTRRCFIKFINNSSLKFYIQQFRAEKIIFIGFTVHISLIIGRYWSGNKPEQDRCANFDECPVLTLRGSFYFEIQSSIACQYIQTTVFNAYLIFVITFVDKKSILLKYLIFLYNIVDIWQY